MPPSAVYVQPRTLSGHSGSLKAEGQQPSAFGPAPISCSPNALQEVPQSTSLLAVVNTCSILERGAQVKLAPQMANVYNGIESCPA